MPDPKRVLFIDRDGTIIQEVPPTYQVDSFEKLSFYPRVFEWLGRIARELDYELVLVTNQDGLGTDAFPEADFWPVHNLVMGTFADEGIIFREELIDRSFPGEGFPTRKPGTGMFGKYLNNPDYDLAACFVIGDRITDVQLAKNLGCKAIWLKNNLALGASETADSAAELEHSVALETQHWKEVYEFLRRRERVVTHRRRTAETDIEVTLSLEGSGRSKIHTGIPFFDHMLDQLARHGALDLEIRAEGDLQIDEHHTIEDTSITLGEAFAKALGNKRGIERYGFALPMDDAEARVLLDFGGRAWIVWNAVFRREKVGGLPTELFYHFFKSFSDAAHCNLHIECRGDNEHHKIEAIFKAFAKAVKMAVRRDPLADFLPSTKGAL